MPPRENETSADEELDKAVAEQEQREPVSLLRSHFINSGREVNTKILCKKIPPDAGLHLPLRPLNSTLYGT